MGKIDYKDAAVRERTGERLWFVSPTFWARAALSGSVFAAAICRGVQYSTLAPHRRHAVGKPGEGTRENGFKNVL